ncbi:trans-sialidase, putative [Trypanosoma cruzi marinkellei]|uniref:Trans-sialidase, putative n=1 Tax=Trypanosoma cruzi marinkellei TaxID=85056 RepID=K2M1H0_TRYCR|nr:trans-sialidase, putative [Trypanosoma cruzi marinkellei]
MVSVSLTEQLERVKKVLATWQEVDKSVSQLCVSLLAQKGVLTNTVCSADKIPNGLVGFLAGNFSDNTWRDEYLGVDATVKSGAGAEKTSDGVTFRGAGAEWPVGKQGENQLYHFANYNFTLVATVSIHKVPEGDTNIPLMGVRAGKDEHKLMELSYNKEKKWKVVCGDENTKELSSNWATDTKRHVVILLRNGNQTSAYVDGERVGNQPCTLDTTDSKLVSHFYIGGYGDSAASTGSREGVPVTVTNVLLYNRPLSYEDITALNTKSVTIPKLDHLKAEPRGASLPAGGDAPQQGTRTPSTPAGQQRSEQGHSMGSSKDASGEAEGVEFTSQGSK